CWPGGCLPPEAVSTTLAPRSARVASTPRTISRAHSDCISGNTRSTSGGPEGEGPRERRLYWWRAINSSTRARVEGATSERPFSAVDTVGTDTPASAAIEAIVARGRAAGAVLPPDSSGAPPGADAVLIDSS